MSDKFLPDKAIDIMDEAGARAHIHNLEVPKHILKIPEKKKKIKFLHNYLRMPQSLGIKKEIL